MYWPVAAGQTPSPLEDVRDFAKAAGYTNADRKPHPSMATTSAYSPGKVTRPKVGPRTSRERKDDGWICRVGLSAEYRNSGIMTFVVDKDGVVYQKDLGEKTVELAQAMAQYDPGDGWKSAI